VQAREEQHEEEIGGPVHRRLADVPDDAVPRGQVPRVAHQDGGVLLGLRGEIEGAGDLDAQGGQERRRQQDVEGGVPDPAAADVGRRGRRLYLGPVRPARLATTATSSAGCTGLGTWIW
jgi:hypothetical protein